MNDGCARARSSDRSWGSHPIPPYASIWLEFLRDPIFVDQLNSGVKKNFHIHVKGTVPNVQELKSNFRGPDQLFICFFRLPAALEHGCLVRIPYGGPIGDPRSDHENGFFFGREE